MNRPDASTHAEIDLRCAAALDEWERRARVRALALCRGCTTQYDSRRPCPRCAAFRRGVAVPVGVVLPSAPEDQS